MEPNAPEAPRAWSPLNERERRVVGVLVEKQKTTPDAYPLSLAALVTGCNQKSNRDPVTDYDADDVEEILDGLRRKGAVLMIEGSGRVVRWRHALYEWLGLKGRAVEMAVLAELLLRGPQTEGELRQRASRMNAVHDLPALQAILNDLQAAGLATYLTPTGVRRGAIVSHGLYPPEELERLRSRHANQTEAAEDEPSRPRASSTSEANGRLAALAEEVAALRERLETLEAEFRASKTSNPAGA